ncbi:hypothetical protein KBB08_02585 [Candidatus Gracilibacteria bacterium]|nr:hypothetical protein [Candidatus Gracilibacteria bacterium]
MKKAFLVLLGAWVAILPWHAFLKTWFSSLFLGSNADYLPAYSSGALSAWKEILLLVLLLTSIGLGWQAIHRNYKQLNTPWFWCLVTFVITLIAFGTHLSTSWGIWALALRTDLLFVPVLALGWITSLLLSESQKHQILKISILSLLIATTIGITAWFVAPSIGLHFGYSPYESSYVENKPLPIYHCIFLAGDHCIPRLQATFSGPNQAGGILIVLLALLSLTTWSRWWSAIPGVGLLLTFSRSALLGALIALATWLKRKWLVLASVAAVGLGSIILLLQPELITHGGSSIAHEQRKLDGIQLIIDNPLGLGLGNAGPVSRRVFGEDKAIISESWYLQLGEEAGVIPLIFFILFIATLIYSLYQTQIRSVQIIGSMLLALSLQAILLHIWEDSVLTMLAWFWVGIHIPSLQIPKSEPTTRTQTSQKVLTND